MNQQKEHEFVDGAEVIIRSVEVQENPNKMGEVRRIAFETDKGTIITWKPKARKQQLMDGLKVIQTVPLNTGELPTTLVKIGKSIADKGECLVKAFYHIWHTEQDGSPVTYRFVRGEAMFDKWKVIEQERKVSLRRT